MLSDGMNNVPKSIKTYKESQPLTYEHKVEILEERIKYLAKSNLIHKGYSLTQNLKVINSVMSEIAESELFIGDINRIFDKMQAYTSSLYSITKFDKTLNNIMEDEKIYKEEVDRYMNILESYIKHGIEKA